METLTFGSYNRNIVVECCSVSKETEKALLFVGIKSCQHRRVEVEFWLPKSVYNRAAEYPDFKCVNINPVFHEKH